MEVLDERLSIDCDASRSRPDVDDGAAGLALAEAPGAALAIKLGLSALLRQGAPEVEEIDAVELGEVVGAVEVVRHPSKRCVIEIIREFAQVSPQVVLIVRVLPHCMEQSNLLVLLGGQGANRVVPHGILEFDFFEDFLGPKDMVCRNVADLRLVIHPVRLLWIERINNVRIPVEVILAFVFCGRQRLLQDVLIVIPLS